jgi:hypothetical protein
VSESNTYDQVGNIASRNGVGYTYGKSGHVLSVTAVESGMAFRYDRTAQ